MNSKQSSRRHKDRNSGAAAPGGFFSNTATRETVESIVIAFILAFLFRAFEAEAFVIPTGSMAPTLQGRHKDVNCAECGHNFRSSASQENRDGRRDPIIVQTAVCPMCGYVMDVRGRAQDNDHGRAEYTYNGDRIIVTKFAYEFNEPERWDVIVFKYPGNAKMNYIKRLVGLPNETVKIFRGDIFTAPHDDDDERSDDFTIARKQPTKLLAMLQLVHDNQHYSMKLLNAGWPASWQPWDDEAGRPNEWTNVVDPDAKLPSQGKQTLRIEPSGDHDQWIRYQHYFADDGNWTAAEGERQTSPNEQLTIGDYYAYNQSWPPVDPREQNRNPNWVGDLVVECDVEVLSGEGELLLELREGGRTFQCVIDVATGEATLGIDGGEVPFEAMEGTAANSRPVAQTSVKGTGRYQLRFSNCDDQLLLWVDDHVVDFDGPTGYSPLDNHERHDSDFAPIGIGSHGVAVELHQLRVRRDVYYVPIRSNVGVQFDMVDRGQSVSFPMGEDQFLVLGDNSPQSKDSRLWEAEGFGHYVPRDLLIGKALFIYWPHSRRDVFPFCPNFQSMKFVR